MTSQFDDRLWQNDRLLVLKNLSLTTVLETNVNCPSSSAESVSEEEKLVCITCSLSLPFVETNTYHVVYIQEVIQM